MPSHVLFAVKFNLKILFPIAQCTLSYSYIKKNHFMRFSYCIFLFHISLRLCFFFPGMCSSYSSPYYFFIFFFCFIYFPCAIKPTKLSAFFTAPSIKMRRLYDLTFIYFYDYTLFLCVHFGRTIVKNLYSSQYTSVVNIGFV